MSCFYPKPCNASELAVGKASRLAGRRGFALLVTIVLVSFLVLILVGLASFTRVETQVAANSQQLAQARQNALMALNVALGQLQQAAGPDQRVTARAEILDSASTVLRTDVVKQPLWTGVWKTGNASLDITKPGEGDPQRKTSFSATSTNPTSAEKIASATWLVSKPSPTTVLNPATYAGITTGSAPDAVELVKSIGTNQNVTVVAPLAPIMATVPGIAGDQVIGKYAYWVSDEGLKAKVNISDPTAQKKYSGATNIDPIFDLPQNLLHFAAPQAIAAHKILPDTLAKDFRAAPNIDQVLTPQQLPLLPATSPSGYIEKKHTADITTYGFGVLSDVRNGGLKKDLTAAFEDNGNAAGKNYAKLNPDGTARVYRAPLDTVSNPVIPNSAVAPAPATQGLDGLRWINLFTYYNLYKSTFPAINMGGRSTNNRVSVSGYVPSGIGNPDANGRPYAIAPRGHAWSDTTLGVGTDGTDYNKTLNFGALAPVVLGYRWDVSVGSADVAGGWTLNLNYYPQLILYNPYAVTLSAPLNNFRLSKALAAAGNFYLETTVGSGKSAKTYFTMINQAATLQRLLLTAAFDDMQTFKPGEIRVFGLNPASSGLQSDSSLNVNKDRNYSQSANGKMTAITVASEIKDTNAPYGMLSKGYASTLARSAALQVITGYGNPGGKPSSPDTYDPMPVQAAGTPISIRLISTRPTANNVTAYTKSIASMNATINASGSSDNSLPRALYWPSDNANGGSVLGAIPGRTGSDGGRYGQGGAPGSPSADAKPVLNAQIDTLGETQVLSIFVRKKGVNITGGNNYSNAGFAVPYFSGNSTAFNIINDFNGSKHWDELYIANISAWPGYPSSDGQAQTDITSTGHTTSTWGDRSAGDATSNSFGSRIILADVPVQPMLSLGQFMHVQQYHMFSTGNYTSLGFGSMFVGGSLPSAEVPTDQTALNNGTQVLLDHSYLANQKLFDSYFFSTVPPSGAAPSGTSWPKQWVDFNTANKSATLTDTSTSFLNRRMTPININGQVPVLSDLRDMDKAAANLILNGAFNVNSTSVDAWRALLSSLSGNDLSLWDASTESEKTFTTNELLNPVSRFWSSNTGSVVNTLWSGVRALNDKDITNLATQIVTQVKTRGPFLSMADFLNRRLGSNLSDLSRAGALQAAIDTTDLNKPTKLAGAGGLPDVSGITPAVANAAIVKPIPGNMYDASSSGGAPWKSIIGAPGYLMQQDLVQAFSPVMSVRSDTFLIRTYGEVVNPLSSSSGAKAWLEAVVQRLPEYINASADTPDIYPPTDATNQNQIFGRKFKVISIRWLSSNEI